MGALALVALLLGLSIAGISAWMLARIRKRVAHWNASPPAPFTLSVRARIVPLDPSERDRVDEVVLDAENSLEAALHGEREGLAAAEAYRGARNPV
jgi:hypothetical protein